MHGCIGHHVAGTVAVTLSAPGSRNVTLCAPGGYVFRGVMEHLAEGQTPSRNIGFVLVLPGRLISLMHHKLALAFVHIVLPPDETRLAESREVGCSHISRYWPTSPKSWETSHQDWQKLPKLWPPQSRLKGVERAPDLPSQICRPTNIGQLRP